MSDKIQQKLAQLQRTSGNRRVRALHASGAWVREQDSASNLLNFSGNDYLGLAGNLDLQTEFFQQSRLRTPHWMAASSSRALAGTSTAHTQLEAAIAQSYQREAALLFNSGYHANVGILPAITDKHDLVLADKLVHASVLDGLRLGNAQYKRFAHNDMQHLEQLLSKYAEQYDTVWIVAESLYSMDGDIAPILELVQLKQRFNAFLYLDEAHAIGCYGENGLGLASAMQCQQEIDILVATFGKALAGVGGFVCAEQKWIDTMVNFARPWLFSTALPPLNLDWNHFIWQRLPSFDAQRQQLRAVSLAFKHALEQKHIAYLGDSHIVPIIKSDNHAVVALSQALTDEGILALPIRSPTVAKGRERVRFSLTAALSEQNALQCADKLHRHY